MALWGNKDDVFSPGSVSVNYATKVITGSGTSFLAASVGDVISIGAGKTFGEAIIDKINSQTSISIATTQFLSGAAISGVSAYTISQKPKFTQHDTHFTANQIFGVDESEIAVNTSLTHAGWVGIITYVDSSGELRTKTETLVAMSGITTGTTTYSSAGDAADDVTLPDVTITITSQPASVGVGTTQTATFSVVATAVPNTAPLSYQWKKSTTVGGSTYADIAGAINPSVSIANNGTANNGYRYRVVITSGDASVTSGFATLTVS